MVLIRSNQSGVEGEPSIRNSWNFLKSTSQPNLAVLCRRLCSAPHLGSCNSEVCMIIVGTVGTALSLDLLHGSVSFVNILFFVCCLESVFVCL